MRRALLVLGGGGHGRVVADAALELGYARVLMLDDGFPKMTASGPFEVVGAIDRLADLTAECPDAVPAIGDGAIRLVLVGRLRAAGYRLPAIVHPSAVVSKHAMLGDGVFVGPGAVINIGARIGEATIVNTGARIDHDCLVDPGCHVAPGAILSGNVSVGERAWIGTGACVRQGVSIGARATVGVGAAVVADLPEGGTYVGVPARRLNERPESPR
jgi:UDP-perosamine 4-acetyltransferase